MLFLVSFLRWLCNNRVESPNCTWATCLMQVLKSGDITFDFFWMNLDRCLICREEDQRFKRSKLAQNRAEAETRAAEKAVVAEQRLREKHKQDLAKARWCYHKANMMDQKDSNSLEVSISTHRNKEGIVRTTSGGYDWCVFPLGNLLKREASHTWLHYF